MPDEKKNPDMPVSMPLVISIAKSLIDQRKEAAFARHCEAAGISVYMSQDDIDNIKRFFSSEHITFSEGTTTILSRRRCKESG